MRNPLCLIASVALFAAVLTSCGQDDGRGAEACTIYQTELTDEPAAIASVTALAEIKEVLSELDDPTRRAFAALLTAADANPYLPSADPSAVGVAAAEARTTCLAEHSIEIPAP